MAGGPFFREVNMNLFEIVKENVTLRKASEAYGITINRSSMCCCPFHNDDSPSMKLYDNHFYCFGCGEHGDVIDFVSKLFALSSKEAAKRLAQDFGISFDRTRNSEISTYKKESILRKIKAKQDKGRENHAYNVLRAYFRLLQNWKREYAPTSSEDDVDPRFIEALTKSAYIEHLMDSMISENKENRGSIITDSEIVQIENTLKKYTVMRPNKRMDI